MAAVAMDSCFVHVRIHQHGIAPGMRCAVPLSSSLPGGYAMGMRKALAIPPGWCGVCLMLYYCKKLVNYAAIQTFAHVTFLKARDLGQKAALKVARLSYFFKVLF